MALNAPRSRTIVLTDAGTAAFTVALAEYDGTVSNATPTPAPVFTTPASVSSDGTPQAGERLLGIDGVASNADSYRRRWLLGTTVLATINEYFAPGPGQYRFESIATGPGGETTSGSNITVAAASPVLNALTISPSTATVGTSATLTISGATAGSVITGTVPAGMTLNSAARTITGTPTTAGSPSIVLTETLAGATGSPRQSTVNVTIAAAPVTPVLGALTVSPSSATVGTAYSGTINGLSSGSSIALSGAGAAGLSIAGAVITGTPTTTGAVNIIETLAGATGSPRTSSDVITVAAAAAGLPTPTTAARQIAYGTSLPHDVINMKSTQRRQMLTRKRLTLAANAPSFYGTFDNVFIGTGGEEANISTLTIKQHAYIVADGSASKIVTFDNGASTTKVLASGAIKIPHDPVTLADLGLTTFKDKDIVSQTQVEVSDGETTALFIMNAQLAGDDFGATFPVETAVITAPGIGTPTAQTGQVVVNALGGYTVSAIIGVHNGEVLGQDGDSISWGTGDTTYVTNRMSGMSRSGLNAADQKAIPVLRLGRPGTSMPGRLSTTGGAMRRAYLPHITHYRENFAANDLSTAPAAGTNVSVYANKETLWAEAYSLMGAGSRVTSVLPIPRTTSGTSNTPHPGWGLGGEADLLRQKILAGLAAGKINSVVTANAIRLSSDPTSADYWLFKNTNIPVSDGTHLSPIGYATFLPELRANTARYAANDETVFTPGMVANDPFNDATAVLVTSRQSASGHSWAPIQGSSAALTTTGAGRAYQNTAGGLGLSAALSPRQFADLDAAFVSFSNAEQGVILRDHPTQNSRYHFNYAPGTGLAKIIATINGTGTTIASVAVADPGSAYTLRGEADGPNLRLLINGLEVLAIANASLSNGKAGLSSGAASTSTTGRQYDAFRAGNLA